MVGGASIGAPELIVAMVAALFWVIPIALAVWVVITLRKIRAGQQAVQVKLDAIERLIERS
jgi:hypothetical protein